MSKPSNQNLSIIFDDYVVESYKVTWSITRKTIEIQAGLVGMPDHGAILRATRIVVDDMVFTGVKYCNVTSSPTYLEYIGIYENQTSKSRGTE